MDERSRATPASGRAEGDACWNRIGVRGDRSCPDLRLHVHCRNCPVFAAGAARLLDREPPAGYRTEQTSHFAVGAPHVASRETKSVVIFRIAGEWLALPATVVTEIATLLPVHSLPHRKAGAVLGIASVRGELLLCVSLGSIVGVAPTAVADRADRRAYPRLLVIRRDKIRAVCPVDEVHGIHRFNAQELRSVPPTVARAPVAYSTAILTWQDRAVGVLDDQRLFDSLKRSIG